MPGWVIVALAFGTGVTIGLLFGGAFAYVMVKARFMTSNIILAPEAQQLLDCLNNCAEAHPFESKGWDRCMRECVERKRSHSAP